MGGKGDTPITVVVQPLGGQVVDAKHTFAPVLPSFIRGGQVLKFDLYQRTYGDRLVLLRAKDSVLDENIQNEIREKDLERRLYVRGDQEGALLEYQEALLQEVLRDGNVTMDAKCEAVHQVTTSISRRMFERPVAANLERQRRNVYQLVDFTMCEKSAARGLVRLAHHDYYTYTHSVNVGMYGLVIALSSFGRKPQHNLREIVASYFLHDVGKCRVGAQIINKPGPLDDAEWAEMKQHPVQGYEILEREQMLSEEMRAVVLQHHERMDGKGYPKGLKGEDINPYARICSVADAFDALTSHRSYRRAYGTFEALKIMKEQMSAQFDPTFYKIFVLQLERSQKHVPIQHSI